MRDRKPVEKVSGLFCPDIIPGVAPKPYRPLRTG